MSPIRSFASTGYGRRMIRLWLLAPWLLRPLCRMFLLVQQRRSRSGRLARRRVCRRGVRPQLRGDDRFQYQHRRRGDGPEHSEARQHLHRRRRRRAPDEGRLVPGGFAVAGTSAAGGDLCRPRRRVSSGGPSWRHHDRIPRAHGRNARFFHACDPPLNRALPWGLNVYCHCLPEEERTMGT